MSALRDSRTGLAIAFACALSFVVSCDCGPAGIEDRRFACTSTAQCLDGYTCTQSVCVKGGSTGGGSNGIDSGSTGGGSATGGGTGSDAGGLCPGVGTACYSGSTGCPSDGGFCLGSCRRGTVVCDGGVSLCFGQRTPRAEDCANQNDDDCNGLTDCEESSCNNNTCGTRRVCCGGNCTSITTAGNCGGCGISCSAGASCVSVGTGSANSPASATCTCTTSCPGSQICTANQCACTNSNQCPAGASCSPTGNYCYHPD